MLWIVGLLGVLVVLVVIGAVSENSRKAEIEAMRRDRPDEYLAKLKKENAPNWEAEFKALRPSEYEKLQTERARQAAEAEALRLKQAAEAEALRLKEEAEFQALRAKDLGEYLRRLRAKDEARWREELKVLRPKEFAAYEAQRKAEEKLEAEREERARQRRSPLDYLTLDFNWYKGGFDNVMIANFTIKSTLYFSVKDVVILCTGSGNSGTAVDLQIQTIYETIPAKGVKRANGINMGLIPQQMTQANCKILRVEML